MLNKETKTEIISKFAQSEKDTGSSEIQIAILSARIDQIASHLKSFPKDKHSRYGLVKLVGKRRVFYNYLKKHDKPSYEKVIKELKVKG